MKFSGLFVLLLFAVCGCRTTPQFRAELVPAGTVAAIDASFWRNVPAYELEAVPGFVKRFPVLIQFAYDSEALYFRFDAGDDDLVDEAPEYLKSGLFLYADTLELFLRPPESRGYWEFHFSTGGRSGAIHFPARGRRMPSNVAYLPMKGLTFEVKRVGSLNDMNDRDERWMGLARIPFAGIADRCAPVDFDRPLPLQVTSFAYSVHADCDERSQLTCDGRDRDPHYLPAWGELVFVK